MGSYAEIAALRISPQAQLDVLRSQVAALAAKLTEFTKCRSGGTPRIRRSRRDTASTDMADTAGADAAGADGATADMPEDVSVDCGESFTAGTKVLLASGKAIPISHLKPGDKVLATNVKTGVVVLDGDFWREQTQESFVPFTRIGTSRGE